uniref:Potassium channel domain-containing protein n=1 Tax=Clytia hemisphaerica TaxID=252671 RepID=A0A7M5V348_9CNID
GIILELVSKGLKECCRNNITSHYEEKYIDITRLVEASVNSSLDLVLPIRTNVGKELFIAFPFVGLVESPGAVFYNLNRQETRKAVVNMIMASLPAVALLLVWVCVFGVLFWICDIIPQRAILNRSFRVKCGEIWDSVWWSFVTLATVGYGDVVPTRIPGRILCYIWLMFSNVAIACFSATVTSILIAECFNSELTIEGSKIGVVNGSREHSFVLKSAGLPIAYKSITDLLDVLHVNTVDLDGILIDLYTASYHIHDLHTFRIQKIFEDVSTYGVVFRTRMVHIR